jgi:hypothetical protein
MSTAKLLSFIISTAPAPAAATVSGDALMNLPALFCTDANGILFCVA